MCSSRSQLLSPGTPKTKYGTGTEYALCLSSLRSAQWKIIRCEDQICNRMRPLLAIHLELPMKKKKTRFYLLVIIPLERPKTKYATEYAPAYHPFGPPNEKNTISSPHHHPLRTPQDQICNRIRPCLPSLRTAQMEKNTMLSRHPLRTSQGQIYNRIRPLFAIIPSDRQMKRTRFHLLVIIPLERPKTKYATEYAPACHPFGPPNGKEHNVVSSSSP